MTKYLVFPPSQHILFSVRQAFNSRVVGHSFLVFHKHITDFLLLINDAIHQFFNLLLLDFKVKFYAYIYLSDTVEDRESYLTRDSIKSLVKMGMTSKEKEVTLYWLQLMMILDSTMMKKWLPSVLKTKTTEVSLTLISLTTH